MTFLKKFLSAGVLILTLLGLFSAVSYFLVMQENKYQAKLEKLTQERKELEKKLLASKLSAEELAPLEFLWPSKPENDPSLELQKVVANIAQEAYVEQLLLDPYDETESHGHMTVSIEFETEAPLNTFSKMLANLESHTPPLMITSLNLRPISSYDDQETETLVYARLLIAAFFAPDEAVVE